MRVRCIRVLEGGRLGGRDITADGTFRTVDVGRDYVVLGIRCRPNSGVEYSILREDVYPALSPALLTAEMFEIVNPTIPNSWVMVDAYGDGTSIRLEPKAWADEPAFFERKVNGDGNLIPLFIQEVERMYAEEGLDPPAVNP